MSKTTKTRDCILDAAAEILETQGLKQLNTNALAAQAGVTPPTVYRNFPHKEAVVIALAERFIEAESWWLQDTVATADENLSAQARLSALIDAYWAAAKRERGMVALRGAMRVWPELKEIEATSLDRSSDVVARVLAELFPEANQRKVKRTARYVFEQVCSTIDRCYPLGSKERSWRLSELKTMAVLYVEKALGRD